MKKQIISFFPFLPTLQLNTILYHNSTLSLSGTILDKASVTKIFSTKTSKKDLFSYRSYCPGSALDDARLWRAVIRSLLVVMMVRRADTSSLHNHKNCLSPWCCRHSKLFSSFYSFKNLPSFFTTLNNKDFEAIKHARVFIWELLIL